MVFLFSNSVGGRRMNVVWSIGGMTVAGGKMSNAVSTTNPISAIGCTIMNI
jgi:hypothetical protein